MRQHGLLPLLDGTWLGAALAAEKNDLTLQHIAELTDIFWIGGTKFGALLGNAIVVPNLSLREEFNFSSSAERFLPNAVCSLCSCAIVR